MRKFLFLIFTFAFSGIISQSIYSVYLVNDSPFPLTAIVQAADGSYLGQKIIQPGEQNQTFNESSRLKLETPAAPTKTITPFVVIWKCAYEGYYSVCSNVLPGGVSRASDGSGSKMCKPRPVKGQGSEGN